MAKFAPSFSKQFSNNCQNLVVTDTSNYDNNDEEFDKASFLVRQVVLKTSGNTQLAAKDITIGDSVSFDLDLFSINQLYLIIELNLSQGTNGYTLSEGKLLPCILP